jgi:hypothetical protein
LEVLLVLAEDGVASNRAPGPTGPWRVDVKMEMVDELELHAFIFRGKKLWKLLIFIRVLHLYLL